MSETLMVGSVCRLSHRTHGAYSSISDKDLLDIKVRITNFSSRRPGRADQAVDVVMVSPRPGPVQVVKRESLIPLCEPFSDGEFNDAFV